MNASFYQGRRVFVTGHTGFKGAWLCEWLLKWGAEVHGYALSPPTEPALFAQLDLENRMHHTLGDVLEVDRLRDELVQSAPDVVFHLAAQPLVRQSYAEPVATFATNVLGTVHLLEALRGLDRPCAVVVVTSDKCYENREWSYGYREIDRLGGADPYSCSKAMTELAVDSYRRSFWREGAVRVATARAGNVIGGGDWAPDRIVPDCVRAVQQRVEIAVRNRGARRPWQHVLEPLWGYLHLASELARRSAAQAAPLASAFNFGPSQASHQTVERLVEELLRTLPGTWKARAEKEAPPEARLLHLCTDKANLLLNWRSRWDFETAVAQTARWYQRVARGESPRAVTQEQITAYEAALENSNRTTNA